MSKNWFLLILLVPHALLAQEYPVVPLENLLSKEQQAAMGIGHQTEAQRESLRRYLIDLYRAGYSEGAKSGVQLETQSQHPQSSSVIESSIDGEFKGWEGETTYKLINGQVWQQASYHYHYHYAYSPKVLIFPSAGGFKMKVDGDSDDPISVKRLK